MTDKPILSIDIDDGDFKAFAETYEKFKTEINNQPGAWAEVANWAKQTRTEFEKMNKAALAGGARDKAAATAKISSASAAVDFSWGAITRNSKLFFENIKGSTFSLLKWSGLTAAFSGILSSGGLFGIERMAGRVSPRRTSAAGLGVSYGERQSFLTNFGRLGNAEGLLGGFNRALVSTESRAPLVALLGSGVSQTHNASEAFAQALPKIKAILDKSDPNTLTDMLRARQWDKLGIDVNVAQMIQGMKPSEIQDMVSNYRKNTGPMGMDKEILKNWQTFDTQLDLAGRQIETEFAKHVGIITPSLGKLTDALTNLFASLLKNDGPAAKWLKQINKGLEGFADEISSGQLDNDIRSFLSTVSNFLKVVASVTTTDPTTGLAGQAPVSAAQAKGNQYINFGGRVIGGAATGLGRWFLGHEVTKEEREKANTPSGIAALRNAARRGESAMPNARSAPGWHGTQLYTGNLSERARDLTAAGKSEAESLAELQKHYPFTKRQILIDAVRSSHHTTYGALGIRGKALDTEKPKWSLTHDKQGPVMTLRDPKLQGGGHKEIVVDHNDGGATSVTMSTQTRGARMPWSGLSPVSP